MQEPAADVVEPFPDPEEVEERQLINWMAVAVLAAVVVGIMALTLLPWLKEMRAQEATT